MCCVLRADNDTQETQDRNDAGTQRTQDTQETQKTQERRGLIMLRSHGNNTQHHHHRYVFPLTPPSRSSPLPKHSLHLPPSSPSLTLLSEYSYLPRIEDPLTRIVGQHNVQHILHFLDPCVQSFALLTCSAWNSTIRYSFSYPSSTLSHNRSLSIH